MTRYYRQTVMTTLRIRQNIITLDETDLCLTNRRKPHATPTTACTCGPKALQMFSVSPCAIINTGPVYQFLVHAGNEAVPDELTGYTHFGSRLTRLLNVG